MPLRARVLVHRTTLKEFASNRKGITDATAACVKRIHAIRWNTTFWSATLKAEAPDADRSKTIEPDKTAYPVLYRRAPLFLCRGTPSNTHPRQSPADRSLCLDDCRAV